MSKEKYTIHPIDAVVYDTENKVKMSMCSNGCATTSNQRKQAELVHSVMNWYANIDMKLLSEQLDILRSLEIHFGEDNMNSDACCGVGNLISDLLIIEESLKESEKIKYKDELEKDLIRLYTRIGIDIPDNHEDITQYVYEYILDVVGLENYSSEDINIGFRLFIQKI